MNVYVLRVTVLIFTFLYACGGTALYRHVRSYFYPEAAPSTRAHAVPCPTGIETGENEGSDKLRRLQAGAAVDLTGTYHLANPTIPTTFAKIEYLEIEQHWYDPEHISSALSGFIQPAGSLYVRGENKLAWVAVTPGTVAFETEATQGIVYRFDGKMVKWFKANSDKTYVEITGTLYKMRHGQTLDSMYAVFRSNGC